MKKNGRIILICSLVILLIASIPVAVLWVQDRDSLYEEQSSGMDIPESRYEVECARPEDSSTPDFGEEGEVTTPEETADADESEEVSSSPPEEATSSADTAEEDKDATDSWDEPDPMEYDAYLNMSASEQEAYFLSFSSIEAFFEWYNAAKQKYQEENPGIEIGPGGFLPIP